MAATHTPFARVPVPSEGPLHGRGRGPGPRPAHARRRAAAGGLALTLLLPGCVAYEADPADARSVARDVAARSGGAWTVEEALAVALRDNPEVRAAEAEARAAGAERTVPLDLLGELRGRNDATGVMVDPVALVGLGPRGGAQVVAAARADEALAELAVTRWQTAVAVAEDYAVETALLQVADETASVLDAADGETTALSAVDVAAFERAGLASPVEAAALRAAQAAGQREVMAVRQARGDVRARLCRTLGLGEGAGLEPVPLRDGWLVQPLGTPGELLERPDLRLAVARFERADAAFREAVARQYPSLMIGPNVSLRGDPLDAMAMLQVPVAMQGRARAARARRGAARDLLEAEFLRARVEARMAATRWAAADAAADAAAARLGAARAGFSAARAGLEVEPEGFGGFARAASELVRALGEFRQAAVEQARARVERARAWGWPRVAAAAPEEPR